MDLADGAGLEAVSMRRIAERIGSAPTSIYWYVSDKNELYELMVDAVIGEIELPDAPPGDWRAVLSSLAWATLATYRRHRWYAQLGIHPVPGPGTLRYAAVLLRSLATCGLDDTAAVNILAALNNYTTGFIQRELAWRQFLARTAGNGGPPEPSALTGFTQRPGGDPVPDHDLSVRLNLSGDESFAFGLDCFLDGVAALVARQGSSPTGPALT
jgi:AcrR family transcriptional regulator